MQLVTFKIAEGGQTSSDHFESYYGTWPGVTKVMSETSVYIQIEHDTHFYRLRPPVTRGTVPRSYTTGDLKRVTRIQVQ